MAKNTKKKNNNSIHVLMCTKESLIPHLEFSLTGISPTVVDNSVEETVLVFVLTLVFNWFFLTTS